MVGTIYRLERLSDMQLPKLAVMLGWRSRRHLSRPQTKAKTSKKTGVADLHMV